MNANMETLEWLIGLVLILIFAQSRFNTPSSNRSSTTVYRYYFVHSSVTSCRCACCTCCLAGVFPPHHRH
jgi:hypothetical protein